MDLSLHLFWAPVHSLCVDGFDHAQNNEVPVPEVVWEPVQAVTAIGLNNFLL